MWTRTRRCYEAYTCAGAAVQPLRQTTSVPPRGGYRAGGPWTVEPLCDNQIEDRPVWLARWLDGDQVSGAGLALLPDDVAARLIQQPGVIVAADSIWNCDSVAVARVAIEHFKRGRRDDHWAMQPFYFRPSAAEEVRLAALADHA